MIVDAWLTKMRNVLYGDSETMPTHIVVGTGTTGETANDTTLETEVYPAGGTTRSAISSRSKPSSKAVQFQMNIGAAQLDGVALTETGAINVASGGTLMNRITHTAINKTTAFELRIQILVTGSDV
jgi:hypothetical protein